MAGDLLFVDGPGHLATASILQKWQAVGSGLFIASSEFDSTSANLNENFILTPPLAPGSSDGAVGYRNTYYPGVLPLPPAIYPEFSILDATLTPLLSLTHDNNGIASVRRGTFTGTILATAAIPHVENDKARYIEFMWRISNTLGYVELRSFDVAGGNGYPILALGGLDTQPGAVSTWSAIRFWIGGPGGEKMKDFYIKRGLAPLGPLEVKTCFPNGAGAVTQWTPSAGSNFQNVDEAAPDGEATYNRSQVNGRQDLYTVDLTPVPVNVSGILGIQLNAIARKESGSFPNQLKNLIQLSALQASAAKALGTGYSDARECYDVNPETGVAFTRAELVAAQIGMEHVR